jgi:hypothetical protein
MAGLSYSAHLSQKNSAINSKAKLSGVAKHNLRKYRSLEYDKENIVILWGTDKLVQDVKKVYKEQFDEAVREYNKKQTRDDRKIDDYFEKTAKSNKDMAVELIFQIGDKEFWDKNPDKRRRMDVAFKEMLNMLQKEAPNLVVANAVIHYDEASPHMHVVAVPVADGFKKGMSRQVSKRKVCTKEFLEKVLQGRIREYAEDRSFTWIGEFLKGKEKGRNNDLSVKEYKVKKENEKYEKLLEDKKQVDREIGQKIFENQMAEQKLENTYKKIKETNDVERWGESEINKFERMIAKGPEEPKGLMSARTYREKIVMPFLSKINRMFKGIVATARKYFVEKFEAENELKKAKNQNTKLQAENNDLGRQVALKNRMLKENQKRIDELEDKEIKLDYIKKKLDINEFNTLIDNMQIEEVEKEANRSVRGR